MEEVFIRDKALYIKFKYPFSDIPALTDKRLCMVCHKEFVVGDYKVYRDAKGNEIVRCANAPECEGTVLDWVKP
ncbi:MAG: hypothetical protein P0Y53_13835 [Candidatus Pseudobacter hemicellulosilyticus]|uniref:Uncharacterized protein n=1 Tax=Candidatus Pseudobacter hemicellulosilyticus TaxID=3121375 RepID=A0AAJ5WMZ9_9BACT|nr:MAG: hypothetical protein P0Y53_13835 [Pseudobacter sp.]